MAPVTITANEGINRGEYTNGNDGKGLCPMLNGNLIYPPVAPIPAIRRARGKSPANTLKRSNSMHSLERPEDFIRPDLPSRCTCWNKLLSLQDSRLVKLSSNNTS